MNHIRGNLTRRRACHECLERRDVLASFTFDLFPVSVPKPDGVADVAVGDMDNDGDQDIISVATRGGELLFHENANGEGAFFGSRRIASGVDRPTSALVADLDLDGDLDVVLAARGREMLTWYENQGRGNFSGQKSLIQADNPLNGAASMSHADFDGDGDVDIAVATVDSFVWIENLANGEFSEPHRITRSIMLPSGVIAADIDGDGDEDVVATTALDHRTMWYENNGRGIFTSRHTVSGDTKFVTAVKAKDVDADGDLDVLTTSYLDGAIIWHENESGHFRTSTQIGEMDGISDLSVFDIDGDGDLDMVASTSTVDRVVWFENVDSAATFSEGQTIQSNIRNVRALDSTDINGDGLADIVLASYAHDVVAWFRQAPPEIALAAARTNSTSNVAAESRGSAGSNEVAAVADTDLPALISDQPVDLSSQTTDWPVAKWAGMRKTRHRNPGSSQNSDGLL